jgi:hypothetical protein
MLTGPQSRDDEPLSQKRAFLVTQIRLAKLSTPDPAVFIKAVIDLNIFVWGDPGMRQSRIGKCGVIFTGDVMLLFPDTLASFLEVSRKFVDRHLTDWGWLVRKPTIEEYGQIGQNFREIMFPDFFHQPRLQIRGYLPPEGAIALPPQPDPGNGTDDELTPEMLTLRECERQVLEQTAALLSETEAGDLAGLGLLLDTTGDMIEQVLVGLPAELAGDAYPAPDPVDPRIPALRGQLSLVRAELRTLKNSHRSLLAKLARAWRAVHACKKEKAELKEQLKAATKPAPPPGNNDPPATLQLRLVSELLEQIQFPPNCRHFSDEMKKVCYAGCSLSPKSYRLFHEAWGMPSPTTLADFVSGIRVQTTLALAGGPPLRDYLQDYRRRQRVGLGQVPCVLAFDATPATATGIALDKKAHDSCFAFLLLPLDHRLPDLLVNSNLWPNGKINQDVLRVKDGLCQVLAANGFACHFVATDGDSGMNGMHNDSFAKCAKSTGTLGEIIARLTNNYTTDLSQWPISDLLHLEKNARAKLASGMLALHGGSTISISAASVADTLESDRMRKILCANSPLDKLKDHLALETFTLEVMLELWRRGDVHGAYFMLPFVALNLAVRNPAVTVETRRELIGVAFSVFFDMFKEYPTTGAEAGIYEKGNATQRKTFWSQVVLKRACNLCVGLHWALWKWGYTEGFFLALARIGSHSCECHFGMTRSTLNGDTRWKRFLSAEVTAALVHWFMEELDLSPYIRRFKNGGGCTISDEFPGQIEVDFGLSVEMVLDTFHLLMQEAPLPARVTVMTAFAELSDRLKEIEYVERIEESSPFGGQSITTRFRVISSHPSGPPLLAADDITE